jgi:hypothetical protein
VVTGPAASPVVVGRERVTLLDDPLVQEAYHAAVGRPLDEARASIDAVEERAAASSVTILRGLAVKYGGPVAGVGVVGATRRLPELPRILGSHALLHAAERDLYEQAVIEGATRLGLPVTTVPATGKLFDDASQMLGVDLQASLAALGAALGPPWQKDHKEATAAALVALATVGGPADDLERSDS